MGSTLLRSLLHDVDLLCLDAGNTVVFLDHARLAGLCARRGFVTSAAALARAEGETKIAFECGVELDVPWSEAHPPKVRGWGKTMATLLTRAGLASERIPELLDEFWAAHCALNLWSIVPTGLLAALNRVRKAGVPVAIVSNSEGMLENLFDRLGILDGMDLVLDSGIVGIEKPDPGIFRMALERFGVASERAFHLGDNFATDVLGARAAGVRVALVDPYGHLRGRHTDVPRVAGAVSVAHAIADARE